MPTRLDSALERIGGWWLPTRCVLCGGPGQPPSLDLCRDCELELPVVPPSAAVAARAARPTPTSDALPSLRERPRRRLRIASRRFAYCRRSTC
jgi:hypothetical protein